MQRRDLMALDDAEAELERAASALRDVHDLDVKQRCLAAVGFALNKVRRAKRVGDRPEEALRV